MNEEERAAWMEERRQRHNFALGLLMLPIAGPLGVVLAMTWHMATGGFGQAPANVAPVTSKAPR